MPQVLLSNNNTTAEDEVNRAQSRLENDEESCENKFSLLMPEK